MKTKKLIAFNLILLLFCGAFINFHFISPEKVDVNFSLANLEATAAGFDVGEWWERKDWDCVKVTCKPIMGKNYPSDYGTKVSDGTGTVAHKWVCTGCGNDGFTVD